jgi:hypothetical protein
VAPRSKGVCCHLMRSVGIDLTRSRRENPAFNYGFFRPNPPVFEWVAWKNEEHAPELTRGTAAQQTEIARAARKSFAYAPGVTSI